MQKQPSLPFMLMRRCAAFFYDSLLLLAVYFVVTAVLVIAVNHGEAIRHPAFYLLLYLIGFAFFSVCWMNGGQTLGMKAWHLRVVSDGNRALTLKQSAIRYLCGTLAFGFTYLYTVIDDRHRSLHDRLAGTVLLKVA